MDWTKHIDLQANADLNNNNGMLEFLHPTLVKHCKAVAKDIPTSPELIAAAHLSVCSGVIGDKMVVEAKPGHIESPVIWGAALASSGGAKSPSGNLAKSGLRDIQKLLFEKHEIDCLGLKPADQPKQRFIELSGGTIQGQIEQLMLGSCYRYQDELTGMFNSFNQFTGGKGNDEEKWLELWNGSPYTEVNKGGVTYIEKPRVSIFGMSQPEVFLPFLASKTNNGTSGANGMFARFLFVVPDMPPMFYDDFNTYLNGAKHTDIWNEFNRDLLLGLNKIDINIKWRTPRTDNEIDRYLYQIWNEHFKMGRDEPNHFIKAFLKKDRSHIARLAVVLAAIDEEIDSPGAMSQWSNPTNDPDDVVERMLPFETIKRAVGLYRFYLGEVRKLVARINPDAAVVSTTSNDVDAPTNEIVDKYMSKYKTKGALSTYDFHRALSSTQRKRFTIEIIEATLSQSDDFESIEGVWTLINP